MNAWQRTKTAIASVFKAQPARLSSIDQSRGWFTLFDSSGSFSWQQDVEIDRDTVMANWALFSCITLIASDIGKCSIKLMEKDDGIWCETESPAFSPIIRKPNNYQTRQQFIEAWLISKLSYGNSYILKQRDARGVVIALYVLDPARVQTLIAENGDIYYQLMRDELNGLREDFPAVPASEVIHDRFNCLFHPMQGLSPIYASGLAAVQGSAIQRNSAKFFQNMSRPGGILTAPGAISNETAERLKTAWQTNYSGENFGKIAVLGDGLDYKAMAVNAVDSQMVEQMKLSAEMICSTFHVPSFKIGAGTIPAGQKVDDLNQIYYADCLHALMDAVQTGLTEGAGLDYPVGGRWLCYKFDLDDLLRMDSVSLMTSIKTGIDASVMSPNEGRRRINLPPVEGGEAPLAQQQQYSLAALAERDSDKPFSKPTNAPAASPPYAMPSQKPEDEDDTDPEELAFAAEIRAIRALRKELASEA